MYPLHFDSPYFCIFIPFILILHCIGSLVSFALCLHRRQWWEEELWSLSCHFREPIQWMHCCTVFNCVRLPECKQMVHRTTHCVDCRRSYVREPIQRMRSVAVHCDFAGLKSCVFSKRQSRGCMKDALCWTAPCFATLFQCVRSHFKELI